MEIEIQKIEERVNQICRNYGYTARIWRGYVSKRDTFGLKEGENINDEFGLVVEIEGDYKSKKAQGILDTLPRQIEQQVPEIARVVLCTAKKNK